MKHDLRLSVLAIGLVAALALLSSGCLWGVVSDADTGAPISGATVKYTDKYGHTGSAVTNSKGLYSFNPNAGPIPAAGQVDITVDAPGYDHFSTNMLVQYNDNPNARLPDLSAFWEVRSFGLHAGLSADIAITDLFTNGIGQLWATIKSNGPDTLPNAQMTLVCGYDRVDTTSCARDVVDGVDVPVSQSLSPGDMISVNTGISGLDTSAHWYSAWCAIDTQDSNFVDPNNVNDLYSVKIPAPVGDLQLIDVYRTVGHEVYITVGSSGLAGTNFCWDVAVNTNEKQQCYNVAPAGSQVFYTGLYMNSGDTISASIWSCQPETDDFNNTIVKTIY
jgi:hypothetical protein